ncbi:hypothetical protein EUC41_08200 [Achromobacter denitrificans]|nr:hypothetical protein EC609_32900 [Achromobacter denitrificans]RSE80867.1 hypothetical protein EGU64_20745 [Achromobacter denitrificans]WFC66303.1 hypothetical protein EUC41_08200 [Achromobacter denitrificans]
MFHNNMVYKGYRLTASVSRLSVGGSRRPAFTATVALGAVADQYGLSESHLVPFFESGGSVSSPVMAVDTAINHGRYLVDAHSHAA